MIIYIEDDSSFDVNISSIVCICIWNLDASTFLQDWLDLIHLILF